MFVLPTMPTEPRERAKIALYSRAVEDRPDDRERTQRLVDVCLNASDRDAALCALARLTRLDPDDAVAWQTYSDQLLKRNRAQESVEAARHAVALDGESSLCASTLGFALRAVGEDEEADRVFARAAELDPYNPHAVRGQGQALIRKGAASELATYCIAAAAFVGPQSWLIAQYMIALALLGRGAELAELLDYDALIEQAPVEPPAGFENLAAFNRQLFGELETVAFPGDTGVAMDVLVAGRRIEGGPLAALAAHGAEKAPASAALIDIIGKKLAAYSDGLGDCLLRTIRPSSSYLRSDAIETDLQGAIAPHTHACSWVNLVYYAEVPASVGAHDAAGCMELTPPTHKAAIPPGIWPSRVVRPRTGDLVIFPGYFYHRVNANQLRGRRVAVTFDIHPTSESIVRGVSLDEWLEGRG